VRINARGLPHSEIPGSKPVCGLPELIAAYHVLHRHLAPRHSPYALSSLTIDMRTNAGVRIAFASYPAALILFGTLRVFCGRKKLPFAGYSIVKERCRRRTFVRRNFLSYVRSLARCKRPRRTRLRVRQPEARHLNAGDERVLENTGLEPVTSWLQTRRSPS
jgi:hypothetical protein